MNAEDINSQYVARYNGQLQKLAKDLTAHLTETFSGFHRIDRIAARAKTPKRFIEKATKVFDGKLKYSDPLSQIQDQIGARIITFYLDDVDAASVIVERYYQKIEARELIPESADQFGYFGKHYVLFIPDDLIPDGPESTNFPKFFELQVKTLFQHAWGESGHDLVYKPDASLSDLQKRQVAFAAAQAWGADQVFSGLFKEIGSTPRPE